MKNDNSQRESFSGKLGFVLSCVGAAIGLGNIWMFSWRLGQFGGAAFLIPYFIFVFVLGTTGLIGEFGIGRTMKKGILGATKDIFKDKNIKGGTIIGLIPVFAITGIFIFYIVVVGWILRYFIATLTNTFSKVDIPKYFGDFAGSSNTILWLIIAMIFTSIILLSGITKGIEKLNKIVMPGLLLIFVVLLIKSLSLPGAIEGVKYLLIPKWSYLLEPKTWIMALGQAFFSLSLTGSGMVVYGSYLNKDADLPSAALNTAFYDTIAALLAAFVIVPATFALGFDPAAGPPLLFITIPSIFIKMSGGYFFSILFFMGIIFAAVSSAINMMEAPVEAIMAEFNFGRKKSVLLVATISFFVALPLATNMNFFGMWADFLTIYLAPIGAALSAIVFYWVYGSDKALKEINIGSNRSLGNSFITMSKYIYIVVVIIIVILGAIYGGI
ncbi:sodium-dependent transporter [Clostridium sediminicola]|uniref:sodium-dependent transporter n=1 Tax=Clostridium sediminicola TaxID=3114879 RepID=UPI0031F2324F